LWSFGIFCGHIFPALVCCTKKNLANLLSVRVFEKNESLKHKFKKSYSMNAFYPLCCFVGHFQDMKGAKSAATKPKGDTTLALVVVEVATKRKKEKERKKEREKERKSIERNTFFRCPAEWRTGRRNQFLTSTLGVKLAPRGEVGP
jgi:hypothetical protein